MNAVYKIVITLSILLAFFCVLYTPSMVQAEEGSTESVNLKGLLSVKAIPWGTVSIDGVRVGTTPVLNKVLKPGVYQVVILFPSRKLKVVKKVTVEPGQHVSIMHDFEQNGADVDATEVNVVKVEGVIDADSANNGNSKNTASGEEAQKDASVNKKAKKSRSEGRPTAAPIELPL